ncbi:hypothetical protein RGQ29_006514 [Quercus rubra]|uniref:DUF7722 domain-containing protein n=1 Tax=Quercus rubra TaxID=3512 RepID=A0AAN7E7G9_QUERU|nr:hypothetical protein RGQ29_006514 [Quercus rubra]
MESVSRASPKIGNRGSNESHTRGWCDHFQMPLHYPMYIQTHYETMPEWKLDCLFRDYRLLIIGDVDYKRMFAMGSFLWPH